MKFVATDVAGVFIVEISPLDDDRGFFARTFDADAFDLAGLVSSFPQHSIAQNILAGTIRGLHYQSAPHMETKIVRCTKGALFDVAVDIRRDSPTYGRFAAARLDDRNARALYVPAGCAHGYQTLEPDTWAAYAISVPHAPDFARGIRYDDPSLAIPWPLPVATISERDRQWPYLAPLD